MHLVLLIDEILDQIFENCLENGPHSVAQVARCCRAWREPALNKLWRRLSTVEPLFNLIPDLERVDGVYIFNSSASLHQLDLSKFRSYARRVKHISHKRHIQTAPSVVCVLSRESKQASGVLPDLTSVQIQGVDCNAAEASLSLSSKLRSIDLRLGFKTKVPTSPNHALCDYLQSVNRLSPRVERLNLRGSICPRVNAAISAMSSLRVLTLHTGVSLTPDVLCAVSHFSELRELDVHAGHLDAADIDEDPSWSSSLSSTFPSLTKLRLRACSQVAHLILGAVRPKNLHMLHLDLVDSARTPMPWDYLLAAIGRVSSSLENLTIEHHIDLDEVSQTSDSSPNNLDRHDIITQHQIPSGALSHLSQARFLKSLVFDTTLPVSLRDSDLVQLSHWWPNLEHLNLGAHLPDDDYPIVPSLTPAGLHELTKFAYLKTLALPFDFLNLSSGSKSTISVFDKACPLKHLTVPSRSPPDATALAPLLSAFFPRLEEVDGGDAHETEWSELRRLLNDARSAVLTL